MTKSFILCCTLLCLNALLQNMATSCQMILLAATSGLGAIKTECLKGFPKARPLGGVSSNIGPDSILEDLAAEQVFDVVTIHSPTAIRTCANS